MFSNYANLSAYDRHKKLINDYFTTRKGSALDLKRDTSRDKTDHDVIRENHKFLWNDDEEQPDTWETRLARRYYDKLFKEYCICDLTRYKQNMVALRWRIEKEVVSGKGQFECGSKHCQLKEGLRTWEVNFGYVEQGEKRNALVKLRLCSECSVKLNYHSKMREVKRGKSLKRLGVNSSSSGEVPETTDAADVVKIEKDETVTDPESTEQSKVEEAQVWREKPAEKQDKSREDEFEEYLADLFL